MLLYRYVHKDHREGESWNGTWYAICNAITEGEASDIIDKAKPIVWKKTDVGFATEQADLFIKEEKVGTFYK